MEVARVADGLWRWTAALGPGGPEVGCVYLEADDAVVLVDPLVPANPPERSRFLRALDRDVERLGLPVAIVLTTARHARSAAGLRERYGGSVWAPADGDGALPAGVAVAAAPAPDEVVVWIAAHGALVAGDVLRGGGDGLVVRASGGADGDALRAALRTLLDLPVRHVLLAHGEPALGDGAAALARALLPAR